MLWFEVLLETVMLNGGKRILTSSNCQFGRLFMTHNIAPYAL